MITMIETASAINAPSTKPAMALTAATATVAAPAGMAGMSGMAAEAAPAEAVPAPVLVPNKGDNAWMMTATVLVLLMIVGASPGSTGGGFKTTTLAVLLASTWNVIRGRSEVHLWNRRIPIRIIQRAVTLVVLYLGTLGLGVAALALFEPR